MVGSVLNTAKRLRTVEQDVQHLLAYFTQAVQQGAQPTFTTFKNLWTKHHYSWIYLGNSTDLSTDLFVQSLYAMALDCLDVPLHHWPARKTANVVSPAQTQPEQSDANAHGNRAPNMTVDLLPSRAPAAPSGDLSQVLLASDEDEEQDIADDVVSNHSEMEADIDEEPNLTSRVAEDVPFSLGYAESLVNGSQPQSGHQHWQQIPSVMQAVASFDDVDIDNEIGGFNGDLLADLPAAPLSSPRSAEARAQHARATKHGESLSQLEGPAAHASHSPQNGLPGQQQALSRRMPSGQQAVQDAAPHQCQATSTQQPPVQSFAMASLLSEPVATANDPVNVHPVLAAPAAGPSHLTTNPTASAETSAQCVPISVLPAGVGSQSTRMQAGPSPMPAEAVAVVAQPLPMAPATNNHSAHMSAAPAATSSESIPAPAASAALTGSSAARLMAGAAMRPSQNPAEPCRDMYSQNTSHQARPDPTVVPLATKIGSVYAIYCIYETQPGHTPIYLPLELLQQLLNLVKECDASMIHDVVHVMRQLMLKRAFVVGAVRRPPSRSAAAEAAKNPPSRLAASSLSGTQSKAQRERDCVYHVQCMYRGLGILGSLAGMCKTYKEAKQHAFQKAGLQHAPKGIANLTVGAKLPQLLLKATKQMQPKIAHKKLRGPRGKRKKPEDSAPAASEGQAQGESAPTDAEAADTDAEESDTADADQGDDSGDELNDILDASLADLGSDDEGANHPPDPEDLEEEDMGALNDALPAGGGRGARAAMQKALERRQRKEQAVRSWRKFESNVYKQRRLGTDPAARLGLGSPSQHAYSPVDWTELDNSADAAEQASGVGALSTAHVAPSRGTAVPRPPAPASPAQTASAGLNASAKAVRRTRTNTRAAAAATAPSTASPATAVSRPASASASTAACPDPPGAAPPGRPKRGRPRKNRSSAPQGVAAPSDPAQSAGAELPAQQQLASGGQHPSTSIRNGLISGQQPAGDRAPQPAVCEATAGTGSAESPINAPARASAKPPRPSSTRKRAAAASPSKSALGTGHGALQHSDIVSSPRSRKQQRTAPAASAEGTAVAAPILSQSHATGQPTGSAAEAQVISMPIGTGPANKGKQQPGTTVARVHASASEPDQPAQGSSVNAAIMEVNDSIAEIAYMLAHPDSD